MFGRFWILAGMLAASAKAVVVTAAVTATKRNSDGKLDDNILVLWDGVEVNQR